MPCVRVPGGLACTPGARVCDRQVTNAVRSMLGCNRHVTRAGRAARRCAHKAATSWPMAWVKRVEHACHLQSGRPCTSGHCHCCGVPSPVHQTANWPRALDLGHPCRSGNDQPPAPPCSRASLQRSRMLPILNATRAPTLDAHTLGRHLSHRLVCHCLFPHY